MELFRTIVSVESPGIQLSPNKPACFLGSCFSSHMAKRMNRAGFSVGLNPNGIVFHPLALARGLERVVKELPYTESELVKSKEEWLSLHHHGSFRDPDAGTLLKQINKEGLKFRELLSDASVLFITFGTAYGYEYLHTREIVANCHKLPADEFRKTLTQSDEICRVWTELLPELHKINPSLRVIFTLSPVRYLKEGAHPNQLSKAHLLLAIHELVNRFDNAGYFPAYELVLDELRDYRFFSDDMIHVSEKTADYVFLRMCESYLSEPDRLLSQKIQKRARILEHRFKEADQEGISRERALSEVRVLLLAAGYPVGADRFDWL